MQTSPLSRAAATTGTSITPRPAEADLLLTYGEHSVRTLTGAITGGMNPKNTDHFDTHEDMAHMLKMRVSEGDVVLFKGSRGMRMEKVLQLFLDDKK